MDEDGCCCSRWVGERDDDGDDVLSEGCGCREIPCVCERVDDDEGRLERLTMIACWCCCCGIAHWVNSEGGEAMKGWNEG